MYLNIYKLTQNALMVVSVRKVSRFDNSEIDKRLTFEEIEGVIHE